MNPPLQQPDSTEPNSTPVHGNILTPKVRIQYVIISVGILCVLVVYIYLVIFLTNKASITISEQLLTPLPTAFSRPTSPIQATPSPSYLPPGVQTYTISRPSDIRGPRIKSIQLDPLDIAPKQTQRIRVETENPVQAVTLTIYTDTQSHILKLTAEGSYWTTQWQVKESVNKRYIIKISAQDATVTSEAIVAPRTQFRVSYDEL